VDWSQIVFGSVLVAVLLLLSGTYGRRQLVALRRLRDETLPAEEARHERAKAIRRLVSCALLLVLGLLLAGVLLWPEPAMQSIIDEYKGVAAPEYTPEQKQMIRVWGGTWIAILVLLLIVVALAAADLWSTRGHALRQFRKLQADRRAMIQRQSGRLREEREQEG
jgi:hypothetical protein